ncbi:hypothetical protein K439DRAFT_1385725 [Ramaria rubella]|nr:hypothetical protein K439DRAFT_1385725 [Ramaria rubella]
MSSSSTSDSSSRTLVLCFDGTGSLYDSTNTNVVKFFSLLEKDKKDEQLVYYQAGIGTYSAPGIMAGVEKWIAKVWDEATAWYLDGHASIMGGYDFLMQNYREGDRICLFGFSRGAYTARALAGMLYKVSARSPVPSVGLLPVGNIEQVGFAYNMYKKTGKKNNLLAQGFKQTFSRTVSIEFMGCWDTVSSVGALWSRHLPFTSSNTIIKYFRHALSLDEHRAKFQPNTWHRDAPNSAAASDDPEHGSCVSDPNEKGGVPDQPGPPTDVLEVWFAGCHGDVGGGSVPSATPQALSDITLRWMLREIVSAQCGIQFDSAALARAGIPLTMLSLPGCFASPSPSTSAPASPISPVKAQDAKTATMTTATAAAATVEVTPVVSAAAGLEAGYGGAAAQADAADAVQPLHDELVLTPIWWVLEVIPFWVAWQDETGTWHQAFRWNLGRGRTIVSASPNVHVTVQERMASPTLGYTPRANWSNKPNATWVS